MAEEEQRRILSIDLDVDELTKKAARLKREIDQLNQAQKEARTVSNLTNKQTKEQAIAYQENEAQLRALKTQLRQTNKDIDNNTKAVKAAEGSNDQLRATLSVLTRQYNALSKEQRENTDAGRQLGEQIKNITDELKENESAVGDNRRNVGNYQGAIDSLGGTLGALSGNLDKLTATITAMSTSSKAAIPIIKGLAGQVKALTVASLRFLATPIGALLGVLVGLFVLVSKAMSRSEERMNKLRLATSVVSGVFNALIKVVEPLADILIDGLLAGIDAVVSGLERFERFLGITNGGLSETIRLTRELAAAEAELVRAQREQEKTQLRFQIQAERLRQIRDDESKSIEERIEANQRLGSVLQNQIKEEQRLANVALRAAKLRIQTQGESTENLDRLAEAELKLIEIQERVESQRSEQLTNENSLLRERQQQMEEYNKQIEETRQRILELNATIRVTGIELQKRLADFLQENAKTREEALAAELEAVERNNELELEALEKKYDNLEKQLIESGLKGQAFRNAELELFRLYQQELTLLVAENEAERNRILDESAQEASMRSSDILEQIRSNRLSEDELEIQQAQEKYDALYQQLVDAGLQEQEFRDQEKELIRQQEEEVSQIIADQLERRRQKEQEEADKRRAIKEQLADAELKLLSSIVSASQAFGDRGAELFKSLSTTQALASAYVAINKTLADPKLVFPANAITAAAIGVQAFANVAAIQSLEKGGEIHGGSFGILGGKPHSSGGTKGYFEDGTVVEAQKDEGIFVLNTRATKMLGQLSAINQLNGGASFAKPSSYLQDGGAIQRQVSERVDNSIQLSELANAILNQPISVDVNEIRSVNNRVEVRERTATF